MLVFRLLALYVLLLVIAPFRMAVKYCMLCMRLSLGLLSTGYFILERDGISPCVPAWADSIPAAGFFAQYAPAPLRLALEMRQTPSYFRVSAWVPKPWYLAQQPIA